MGRPGDQRPGGARRFYGELFGWDFQIGPSEAGYYTMCTVHGERVAGMNGEPSTTVPTGWTTYMATDDSDAAARRITDAGGELMMGPLDITGQGRLVVGFDSTGALFGTWQAGGHIGATLVNEPGAVVWNELATRDLAAAQEFYTRVFGYDWEVVDTGDGPAYQTFSVGGRSVGGAMQMTGDWPEEVGSHWTPYFEVEDPDGAAAAAERLGGAVSMPTTDSPYGRFAALRDPQGGVFNVVRSADPGQG